MKKTLLVAACILAMASMASAQVIVGTGFNDWGLSARFAGPVEPWSMNDFQSRPDPNDTRAGAVDAEGFTMAAGDVALHLFTEHGAVAGDGPETWTVPADTSGIFFGRAFRFNTPYSGDPPSAGTAEPLDISAAQSLSIDLRADVANTFTDWAIWFTTGTSSENRTVQQTLNLTTDWETYVFALPTDFATLDDGVTATDFTQARDVRIGSVTPLPASYANTEVHPEIWIDNIVISEDAGVDNWSMY